MNNTNNGLNLFETRMMIRLLQQMYPAKTFFRDTFFKNRINVQTEHVDIDIRKGKRRVAPFVSRKIGHTVVERIGYVTQTFKPELIAPMMITTAEDVMKRSAGENIYGAKSPNERQAEILGQDMWELDNMITRAEEFMCAHVLYNGQIVMPVTNDRGEVIETKVIDFTDDWHFDSANWEDVTTSTPNANFRKWKRDVTKWSGLNPDIAIIGANALEWMYLSSEWRDEQKFFQTNFGDYKPKLMQDGLTFVGYVPSIGIEMYTVDEWTISPLDGNEIPLADPNKILIGCSQAYTSLTYGMVYDVAIGSFALPRVPKSFVRDEPSARYLKLSSAPIAIPHQVDAFLSIEVCTKAPTSLEKFQIMAQYDASRGVQSVAPLEGGTESGKKASGSK